MSDSVRPHRRQPTRLPRPWDSPGKNTGVGCHFLLQCMKVKRESEVAQWCLTLSDPTDHSPSGSSAHGIFQARVLEWMPLPSPDESLVHLYFFHVLVQVQDCFFSKYFVSDYNINIISTMFAVENLIKDDRKKFVTLIEF